MNFPKIIKLLNRKNITTEQLLLEIKKTVETYQQDRENFYIDEFRKDVKYDKKYMKDREIHKRSREIVKAVQSDTKQFIFEFVDNTIDFILDCLNEKKVPVESAYLFLMILATTKEVFAEQNS